MKTLHFKTNAQLKNVLGQDLINDDNVAVLELIKNSFDAGSKSVDVIFKNLKHNKDLNSSDNTRGHELKDFSKLFIVDNGSGMTLNDIEDKWLNIAYSSKKYEKPKYNRIPAGAKGVGRFSCDRLGSFLDLYTKTKNDNKIIHLIINWSEFENKLKINDIIQNVDVHLADPLTPVELEKLTGYKIGKSGTILEISKLRSKWIEQEKSKYLYNRITSLKNSLEKLTNPNQNIDKISFQINLIVKDLSKDDFDLNSESQELTYEYLSKTLVENKIFEKLNFRTTYIESTLTKDHIITSLKYHDKIIFELKEVNAYDALKTVDIKIKIHFLNQYSKSYFKRYTTTVSKEYGSIFLFINGFRILPYGDYGNDWLGLEIRKGQGRARYLGARDMVGWFEIADNHNNFKIISNREGIVKNKHYQQLVGDSPDNLINSYFYSVFRKLELFVVDGLDWDRIYKSSKTEDNIEEDEKAEIKQFMKDFEAQIESNKWKYDPSIERYAESSHEKNMRILNQIFKIVTTGTNKKDIISLYINEEIISELAHENVKFVKSIIDKIDKFENINYEKKTSRGIANIKKMFAKMEEKTTKAEEKAAQEEQKRKQAEEKAAKAEEKAVQEEQKRKQAEEKVEDEKKKRKYAETENIFLKATNLHDKDQIISLFHHIGIHSDTIKSHAARILKDISELSGVSSSTIHQVESINQLSQMINTISKIGFKGGITEEMESDKQDVIQFISEFIKNICIAYYDKIKIEIDNKIQRKYITEFAPFELTYVIDNFISNSKKAGATTMLFRFYEQGNNAIIEVLDDGRGLDPRINSIDDIFNRNVSTTRGGAGLGLYDARNILTKMRCKINAEALDKGFKLRMVIPYEN